MTNVGKKVYAYLKHHGASTSDEISEGTGIWEADVIDLLHDHAEQKFIDYDDDTGKYSIKFVLGKPLNPHQKNHTAPEYGKILQELAKGGNNPPAPTSSIPDAYTNPYLKYLPTAIDQGDRGTCVGFSTAIMSTLAYFADTQDFPTPEEVAAEKRNVSIDLGCPNGKPFVCDVFEKRWKSPTYVYDQSRVVGNVTDPEGSYVSASAKSLTIYGSVFEKDCQTAKTPTCVTQWYPLLPGESTAMAQARIIADGKTRVTQGYAAITAFDDICAAIYKYGYALIAVNIYSNYTTQGCTGNLPDPNGDIVGSHALCLTGYDNVARTLQVRMSWGTDWSDDSGFSERYFNDAAAECYTVLDANETKIGQQLYSDITLNSNVPCTFVVNGEPSTVPVNGVITIERGVNHVVTATPDNPGGVVEPSIVQSITPTGDTGVLNFNFTPVGNVPKKSLVEMIEELIVAIWNLLIKI